MVNKSCEKSLSFFFLIFHARPLRYTVTEFLKYGWLCVYLFTWPVKAFSLFLLYEAVGLWRDLVKRSGRYKLVMWESVGLSLLITYSTAVWLCCASNRQYRRLMYSTLPGHFTQCSKTSRIWHPGTNIVCWIRQCVVLQRYSKIQKHIWRFQNT